MKAYDDLEKLQKARDQLKQSDEFEDVLKNYLDYNYRVRVRFEVALKI